MTGTRELTRLPLGAAGWHFWSECELRTAGLPARRIRELGNEELAGQALGDGGDFAGRYARAQQDESAVLAALCAQPLFREMVTWQNPDMVRNCLVPLSRLDHGRPAVRRRRELKVASYLQRYATKNDTIGFFGPLGLARWRTGGPAVALRPGPGLVAARRVFFEQWAADALAGALAREPGLRPYLRPTRPAAHALVRETVLRPAGGGVALTPDELAVYQRCDGRHSIAALRTELAGYPVDELLDGLGAAGLVEYGPAVPFAEEPLHLLRDQLCAVADAPLRERLLSVVDDLTAARGVVASAAGKPDALLAALGQLDTLFGQATGGAVTRRAGENYAGRRIVYEDTIRDLDVEFGDPLREALAAPLSLLLDAARWFVGAVAAAYRARFAELYEECRAAAPDGVVSLARLVSRAIPDLMCTADQLPPPVAGTVLEFQRRWAHLLAVPAGVSRYQADSRQLASLAAQLFPAGGPVPWSSAVHHSPDIMVAAAGLDALRAGRYQLVLGELHLATNTLDCRVTSALHPRADELLRADAADRGGTRVVPVPSRDSPAVTSRTYPPTFLLPGYTYWSVQARDTGAPGEILAGVAMTVEPGLVVRSPDGAQSWDLLEVLGDYLSAAVMNAFKPLAPAPHRPRVSIDRLVVCRESWQFSAAGVDWARGTDPVARYRAAQHWRRRHALPARVFFRVGTELKPVYLDFTSVTLVNLAAATVRAALAEDPETTFSASEVLPDLDETWVPDHAGERYTAEIRLVVVDPSAPSLAPAGHRGSGDGGSHPPAIDPVAGPDSHG